MGANKKKNLSRDAQDAQDERDMDISEYALAAALIALVIIMAFTDLGSVIADKISEWKTATLSN